MCDVELGLLHLPCLVVREHGPAAVGEVGAVLPLGHLNGLRADREEEDVIASRADDWMVG